jgi:NADH:ubiquinone oxidoreductase subunit F (NADH-binding)/NADH:ubiquinone oxidoreductase subunit E
MIFDELKSIQEEHGYLPADQLRTLAETARVPLYRIQSVASFYPHFHLKPQPAVRVGICGDLSCHLRGSAELARKIRANAPDVAIEHVSCLGQCDRAPAISVNDRIFAHATAEKANSLVRNAGDSEGFRTESALPENRSFASDPYGEGERYAVVRDLAKTREFEQVIRVIKQAGLAGMGGAGFPTHIKWDVVRKEAAAQKYVVCNADESEPGTTKDRAILEFLPHLVIEGMIVCGLATGASAGYLYIRHEYEEQRRILASEIDACRRIGLLGKDILGTGIAFDIEIFVSPGGYICGEGSALLEAIEGKRAEPRLRPPNTATHGLWQKPTALNNVETFAQVPGIFAAARRNAPAAPRPKFVSVTGDVRHPGVFEVPIGTPLSEIVFLHAGGPPAGKRVKAFAPSGAASGFVPASFLDVKLDFKSMQVAGTMLGSGAIVVVAEGRCMVDLALNCVRFFRNESCGKCVPCRIGSQKMFDLIQGWTRGEGDPSDTALIEQLSETMKQTSICGLGQFIPYSVLTALEHFRGEVDAHILRGVCPEGVCPMRAQS